MCHSKCNVNQATEKGEGIMVSVSRTDALKFTSNKAGHKAFRLNNIARANCAVGKADEFCK